MDAYRRNHYVPEWYQYRFIPNELKEKKFYYLDLKPETIISGNKKYKRKDILNWGPPRCFYQDNLYTTTLGDWESTEIEQYFFGKVDSLGKNAVEYFSSFKHPSANSQAFHSLLLYMSIQKLRTPKGLKYLASRIKLNEKNDVLFAMQQLQKISCALWAESVWSIADASQADTKFIISDHPVTVYNQNCFPASAWCRGNNDPDIALSGTHTLFPLSLDKILILTNLSWLRNPYGNPLKPRPNSFPFRDTMFNFSHIQTNRLLSNEEVNEINFIIKKRARRYIAAVDKEWLYPEKKISTEYWNKLGRGYLLMPDPRLVPFTTGMYIGYADNKSDGFDEYGRKPWESGYNDKGHQNKEWITFHAYQGQFARVFGPKYRGCTYEFGGVEKIEASPEYHASLLRDEQTFKAKMKKKPK